MKLKYIVTMNACIYIVFKLDRIFEITTKNNNNTKHLYKVHELKI